MEDRQLYAYLTEGVRMTTENTARLASGNYLTQRWIDLVGNNGRHDDDGRSGEEIARERLERFGIKVIE